MNLFNFHINVLAGRIILSRISKHEFEVFSISKLSIYLLFLNALLLIWFIIISTFAKWVYWNWCSCPEKLLFLLEIIFILIFFHEYLWKYVPINILKIQSGTDGTSTPRGSRNLGNPVFCGKRSIFSEKCVKQKLFLLKFWTKNVLTKFLQ